MIARVGRKEKGRDKDRGRKKDGFRFKYKARSSDQIKKRAEQSGGNFDSPVKPGIDMWRPKSGENVIRILPATWEDFEHYGYDVFMHRFVGSDNSNYVCPNKMKGKPCCMCDEAKELKAEGEDEEAKQIGFQKRVWVWIIDRDEKKPHPQLWDMSWSQDREISSQSTFKNGKVLLIDHPDEGYDVIVKKTGSGKQGTKYSFNIERDSSPIDEDQDVQDEILQFITDNPIPDCFKVFSNEHLQKKMDGSSSAKDKDLDDEDEDDEKPRRGKKRGRDEDDEDEKPNRRRRSRDEDEDEEQEDPPRRSRRSRDEDEEDEDEDDKPRRGRKARDEEEDEEDEDETPRRKKKSRDEEDEDEDDEDERPKKKSKRSRLDEEDEDEEDERPKRKKSKSRDEEDEEDEDEEDERPKRKKKSRDADEDDDEDDRPRRRR